MPVLNDIYIYPVKSLSGFHVPTWPVTKKGLLHDRKWMLIDSDNQFLSQRRIPKMALIKTELTETQLILSTSTTGSISLAINPQDGDEILSTLWNDECLAKTVSKAADQWLSDFLGIECKLVYQPDNLKRFVDPRYALETDIVNFSDGFPFLITSSASLLSLNQAMGVDLPMERFRPNLVISDCDSYAEDTWREITINSIKFRLPKACSRCPIPSIDTKTAERGKEPLRTLSRLRKLNNKVYFGQNALHNDTGTLSVTSEVVINSIGPAQPAL